VMAASDNVLRGGLTPKHIDVDELLEVLDFTPLPVPYLAPEVQADGVAVYRPAVPDFELAHISVPADDPADDAGPAGVPMRQVTITGPAIAVCTAGRFLVAGAGSSLSLARGEAVYITPDEGTLTFAGSGEVFLATTPTTGA
jgi:mannose-6-phosphate isomerase